MSNIDTMPSSKRIAFNSDNCTGCDCCELACSAAHFGVYGSKLSAIRIKGDYQFRKFEAFVCRQCASASCVAACKFDAIKFDESTGARYIDKDLCKNCGLCIKACPFTDETFPLIRKVSAGDEDVIIKCNLCHGINGGPSCVAVCPRTALTVVEGKKGGAKNDR